MSTSDRGYIAHRIAASGLFSLFSLLALALGMGEARLLALATGGSLLALFVFTRAGFRSALGPFRVPQVTFHPEP